MTDVRLGANLLMLIIAAPAAALAACEPSSAPQAPQASPLGEPLPGSSAVEGISRYLRFEPSLAEIRISRTDASGVFVVIQAGGLAQGAATAATCTVGGFARGSGTRLVVDAAVLEDVDSPSPPAPSENASTAQVTIDITQDMALVSGQLAAGRLCPPGSYLDGVYRIGDSRVGGTS